MKKLIIANWKCNPLTIKDAGALAEETLKSVGDTSVVICPPFIFLESVREVLHKEKSSVALGAQDLFWEGVGAYTGEVSYAQLKELGVEYVIVGHSERRGWIKETDEVINKKVIAGLKNGFKVVLCVGEPGAVGKDDLHQAKQYVGDQLEKDLVNLGGAKDHIKNLIVAYEPIWAIGTGIPDTPERSGEMAKFIKDFISSRFDVGETPVLYGGSVNAENAKSFLSHESIDGALVGGASLKSKEFEKILEVS